MYWEALLNLVIPQFVDLKKFSMYATISPRYNNGFISFYNPYTFISFPWLLNVEFIKFFFSSCISWDNNINFLLYPIN